MSAPWLSVIVPAYQVEPWLERCVNSILTDAPADMELILVDDGSTDGTGALCDRLAARDGRVRALHQANGGLAAARNAGLSAARGTYVEFVDGDDCLVPGGAARVEQLTRDSLPDVLRFGFRRVSPEGEEVWALGTEPGLYRGEALRPLRLDVIGPAGVLDYSLRQPMSACAGAFRRAFLEARGLRFRSEREILNEDYLFLLQATWQAESLYVSRELLYCYIVRSESLSTSPRPRMLERKQALYDSYCRQVPRDDPEVQARLRNFYIDGIYNCFVEVCRTAPSSGDARARIGPLLADPELRRCLAENRGRIRGWKPRCICLLMRMRWSGGMYRFYRLSKRMQTRWGGHHETAAH